MEYIDIFDENNNPTGEIKEKTKAHEEGNFHRTAHVWIINNKNELLLQKRSKSKKSHPNCWDISGAGHIRAGESVIDGAIRELKEELGVEVKGRDLQYIATIKSTKNSKNMEFGYVYLLMCNKKIEDYIFEDKEVSEVKYVYYEELEKMVENKSEGLLLHDEEFKKLFEYIRNKEEDKKANIFILHSLNGDTINIWGQDIKENFNKQNTDVFLPEFPIRADSTYEKFKEILKVYFDNKTLNENSIVIAHSIGNAYFIRFCKEMNYIPKAYIAVAPGAVYDIPSNRNDYTVKVKAQAYCKQEQLDFIKDKVENKYCLYSDEDEPKEEMFKRFIEDTNSIGIYLKYYNHFDGYHRIYKIPELTELINKILNGDEDL